MPSVVSSRCQALALGLGLSLSLSLSLGWPAPATAQQAPAVDAAAEDLLADSLPSSEGEEDSLLDLDLEQLTRTDVVVPALDTPVTTVSRRESTVGRSPAAVFVITQEMIQRSGARSIPEALRLAPGVHVARVDSSSWAISIRGFNDLLANKLLVQIDGRAVYTPLFAGTLWDEQDVVLEDVDRIEVIRGPGASVWGANAVNGVINVITKRAEATQGALVVSGGGSQERLFNTARYGGQSGDDLHWRVYGKQFDRANEFAPGGAHDSWQQARTGFRADWTPTDEDLVTFQGDLFAGTVRSTAPRYMPVFPYMQDIRETEQIAGGNLISRWTRQLDEETSWSLQLYYDRRDRRTPTFIDYARDTYDLDYQYNFALNESHRLTAGWGYRFTRDWTTATPGLRFEPASRGLNLYSAFIQDEVTLLEDQWYFTVGTKVERNDFTGFEVQPTARFLFLPTERQSCWVSISRAVRTPARADADVVFRTALSPVPPTLMDYRGSDRLEVEKLIAYEAGYRIQPNDQVSIDAAIFYNDYHDLIEGVEGTPFFSPDGLIVPVQASNVGDAHAYGAELASTWQVTPYWHLLGSYTWMEAPRAPNNILFLQSSWTFERPWELNANVRYVDNVAAVDVPHYLLCDVRLAWTPRERLELAVVGQNLLDSRHLQFRDLTGVVSATEIRRGVYGMLTWRY